MAQPAFGKATLARVVQNTGTLTTQLLADWEQAARRGEPVDVLDETTAVALAWTWLLLGQHRPRRPGSTRSSRLSSAAGRRPPRT